MPGMRFYNFREGDRSEYLANYLMSGIGLVIPVPRQEDIGIDFYCLLADQEKGNLTFSFSFILQVKSASQKNITFGYLKGEKWIKEDVQWLFRQELPFFIGIVYKSEMRIDIYNTSTFWFIARENPNCSQLVFSPRLEKTDKSEVGRPKREKLGDWPDGKGDGYRYYLDLGQPVISLTNSDFDDKNKLKRMKAVLRAIIYIEQNNHVYKRLNLPYFNWVLKSKTNEQIVPAWIYYQTRPSMKEKLLRALAPSLISLALNLKLCNDIVGLDKIKPLIKDLPADMIYENLKKDHPDIFIL